MRLIGLYSSVPRCGKSTVASILVERHGWKRGSFAAPLKKAVFGILSDLLKDQEMALEMVYGTRKDEPIPQLKGMSGRRMQQTLGSEWGRDCVHPDLWVMCAMASVERDPESSFVFDDVRFANEAKAIRRRGGLLVKVARPGVSYDGPSHRSEGALDDRDFDAVIANNGSIEDLAFSLGAGLLPGIRLPGGSPPETSTVESSSCV